MATCGGRLHLPTVRSLSLCSAGIQHWSGRRSFLPWKREGVRRRIPSGRRHILEGTLGALSGYRRVLRMATINLGLKTRHHTPCMGLKNGFALFNGRSVRQG